MKIVCDSCQAKYFVADDKIHKRVVRLTCQRCGHVIVARKDQQGGGLAAADLRERLGLGMSKSATSSDAAPEQATGDVADWYYSKDGQSFGPFSKGDLTNRFGSGELGSECYVWHRDLGDWLPAHSTAPFDVAIEAHHATQAPPPPPNPFAAPKAEDSGQAATLEAMQPSARVQGLKERLGAITASKADDVKTTDQATVSDATEVDAEDDNLDGIDLDFDGASRVVSIHEIMAAANRPKSDVVDLETEGVSDQGGEKSPEWMNDEQSDARDSLFKAIAAAKESMPAGAPVEKSMLIHIDHLRQHNRRVRLYALGAIAAVALLGLAIWAVIYFSRADLEGEDVWEPGKALTATVGDEISDEELELIAPLEEFSMLTDEDIEPQESVAPVAAIEEDSPEPTRRRRIGEKPRSKKGGNDVSDITAKIEVDVDVGKQGSGTAKPKSGLGLGDAGTAELKGSSTSSPKNPTDYSGLTTGRRRSGVNLAGSAEGVGQDLESSKGSKYAKGMGRKVKASERNKFVSGLKKVSKAVQECHKRQLKTGRLGVGKVYIVITVEPTGKVSKVSMDKAVKGTTFESCLKSKQDRWVFEKFDGKAAQLRQGFVLE